jgi:hypothetical protein
MGDFVYTNNKKIDFIVWSYIYIKEMNLQEYLKVIEDGFGEVSCEYVFSRVNAELCKKGNYYLISVCDEKYLTTDIYSFNKCMMVYEFIVIPFDKETKTFKNQNIKIFYYENNQSETHTQFELSRETSSLVCNLFLKNNRHYFGDPFFRNNICNKLKQHYPHYTEYQDCEDNFIHHIHQTVGLVEENEKPECFSFYNNIKLFPIVETDNEIKTENKRFLYTLHHIVSARRMAHSVYTHQTVYVNKN